MRNPITIDQILQTACGPLNQHLAPKATGKQPNAKRGEKFSKEKTWIEFRLNEAVKGSGLIVQKERVFHKGRKWAFDWCIVDKIEDPSTKIAFEYEGLMSKKSRHTTVTGFTGDKDKYNVAMLDGWELHCYTALNYLDLGIDLIMIMDKFKNR